MIVMYSKQRFVCAILTALAWLAFPDVVQAYDLHLCAKVNLSYWDSGYGEDVWQLDEARYASGVRIRVRRYTGCDFSGASGYTEYVPWTYADSLGCAPQFSSAHVDACYELAIQSFGEADVSSGTNYVYGYDDDGLTNWWKVEGIDPPNQSGFSWWDFPEIDAFRMHMTVNYSVRQEHGSLSGKTWHVYPIDDSAICGCGSGNDVGSRTCSSGSSSNICVDDDDGDIYRKFLIAHEYGHGSLRHTVGSAWSTSGCDSHGMTTQEEHSCALMEGWANFMSASVWNDNSDNEGGKIRYWGLCDGDRTIDVETSGNAAGCLVKYMENNYSSGTWPGHATELDWMRALWDYRNNNLSGQPGGPVSLAEMQSDWVGYLPSSSESERAYDDYRKGVADNNGCTRYERLVYMAAANGSDHCEDEGSGDWCDDVPGCTDVD